MGSKLKMVVFLSSFFVLLFALSVVFLKDESPEARDARLNTLCYFGMNRIAIALQEYAEKEGAFPDNLDVLFERRYLDNRDVLCCPDSGNTEPYHYFKGLQKDMPDGCPVLIEKSCPHVYTSKDGRSIRYGRAIMLDFSLNFIREENMRFFIQETESALRLSLVEDRIFLREVMKDPSRGELSKKMASWKLNH